MARLYYRLFYQLHCFFTAISQDGYEEWKALIFVNTLCLLLVGEVGVWLLIFTGANLPNDPLWLDCALVALVGVCAWSNYTFLLSEGRWQAYTSQFRAETAPQQRRAAWGAFATALAVLGSLVGAFYCLSRTGRGH